MHFRFRLGTVIIKNRGLRFFPAKVNKLRALLYTAKTNINSVQTYFNET